MKNNYIPFPPGVKTCMLRRDFPDELAYYDFANCEAVRNKTYAAAMKGLPLPNPFPDDCEVGSYSYERGRYFAYFGAGVKGTTLCHACITDGQTGMLVNERGLFADMLARAENAYGGPIRKLLYPATPARPYEKWFVTNHVVLHDTVTGLAGVMHRSIAVNYLKPFRAKS